MKTIPAPITRRRFLQSATLAGIATGMTPNLLGCSICATAEGPLFTKFGINGTLDQAPELAQTGVDFLLLPTRKFLVPQEPEAVFEGNLRALEKSPLPVLSCNSFLTGGPLRSVGPEAKHENVLRYADTAFRRAKRAGVERIIFGSSGSRKIPEGWSKAQADEQFFSLLKRMAPLAEAQGIIVAVENLQAKECNYLTRVSEVGDIVGAVNHPNVRVLADLYHGTVMGDAPEDFLRVCHLIDTVEIAEAEGRTLPGVGGQDFRRYFRALRAGGFKGPIEMEGRWTVDQVPQALKTIHKQSLA